jgi:hypothetical protein
MVLRPEPTLLENGRPAPPWTVVLREHALPLLAASALVSFLLLLAFPPELPDEAVAESGLMALAMVIRVAVNLLGLMLIAAVVAFYAGVFGGSSRFDASFVLVALAMTPHYLAAALFPLPALGVPLVLVGMGYSLLILYRGLPELLGVPPENRGKLFLLILLSLGLLALMAGLLLGPYLLPTG